MTRDEMLVLAGLNRLCAEAPAFALGFPDGSLPLADEYAFGFRLLDVAHGVLRHAQERAALSGSEREQVGSTTNGPQLRTAHERSLIIEHGCELPPGSQPGGSRS